MPARDEAEVLPQTLPTLLALNYPGELIVWLIDDAPGAALCRSPCHRTRRRSPVPAVAGLGAWAAGLHPGTGVAALRSLATAQGGAASRRDIVCRHNAGLARRHATGRGGVWKGRGP